MNLNKPTKFILAITAQLAVLFSIIIFHLAILGGGSEVLLKIQPVDPRDFLRGDYVTFNYEISSVSPSYSNKINFKNGDTVYVLLSKEGKFWIADDVLNEKPKTGGNLFIKGKIVSGGQSINQFDLSSRSFIPPGTDLNITYGIEQYFIPEGKGTGLNLTSATDPYAQVVIGSEGDAVLKKLYINNKPWP